MAWTIVVTKDAESEIMALSKDLQARFVSISDMLLEAGPMRIGLPYVRPLEGKLWEMRLKGRDGIARAIYFSASGQRIVVVGAFVKKTEKAPRRMIDRALKRMRQFDG